MIEAFGISIILTTMTAFCVLCAGCAIHTNRCARSTQRYQSAEIQMLREKLECLSITLAAEQSYNLELGKKQYDMARAGADHSKIRGYECSVIAVDEIIDAVHEDVIPKQNLDGSKYHLVKEKPEGGAIESPDPEWDAAHPIQPEKPWPRSGGSE